jgi:hypothetical protein
VSNKYSHAPLTERPCQIHWKNLTKQQKKGLAKALGDALEALTKEELGNDEFVECLRKSVNVDEGWTLQTAIDTHTKALRKHYWNKLPWVEVQSAPLGHTAPIKFDDQSHARRYDHECYFESTRSQPWNHLGNAPGALPFTPGRSCACR